MYCSQLSQLQLSLVSAELGKDEEEVTMELVIIADNAKHIIWLATNYLWMKGKVSINWLGYMLGVNNSVDTKYFRWY